MCRVRCGRARRNVLTRRVSSWTASTRAVCQRMGAPGAGPGSGAAAGADMGSIPLVPLLLPRVAAVVVAVALPEPALVVVEQAQPGHPLGALPEVQVGDQQPSRAAVLGGQRLAVGVPCDP